ncbi:MAG: hypothetical protein PHU66_09355, partial [Bacteroidaceae bacterium]|nr:hypothetical protein [Bacteroidaceae bacterium]
KSLLIDCRREIINIIVRKISVVLIATICSICAWGQKSYEDLTNECYKIEIGTGKFYLSGGSEDEYNICKVEQVASLINKDVFGYFGLNQRYETPLQRNTFKKTEEYANYLSELTNDYSCLSASIFYILYNLRYNSAYDINKKSFTFRIGVLDWQRTSQSGYIGFGKNICTSFPANKLNIKRTREYNNEVYAYQYIQIPIADEDLALKIEEDMSNPYCSTCLLFVVELNKVSSEKHPEFPLVQNNILAKTLNLYMVNTKTEEIYCDLSELVGGVKSQIIKSKTVSSKVEFEEKRKNEEAERKEAEARREAEYERQLKSEVEKKKTINNGVGASNLSYTIAGRSAKSLRRPSFNEDFQDGIIIVDIEVNPEGKVVDAKINTKTSINNTSMKQSCLDAALKTEFSSFNTSKNQSGSITYRCRLD